MLQIIEVIAVFVCLSLETDVAIRRQCTPVLHQQHQPFHHVPQVKAHEQQLAHLRRMDAFVVQQLRRQPRAVPHEKHAKQVHSIETAKRNERVMDDKQSEKI